MTRFYKQFVALILTAILIAACAPASTSTQPLPTSVTPAPTVLPVTPTSAPPTKMPTAVPPTEISPERSDSMKIRITVEATELTATLIDSNTTQDFISLLPLTLTLEDYAGIEKISYLPRELSTQDAPAASDFTPGDLAHYAPWGNLAIHHHEFGYANGLVILGTIDGGKEALIVPGPVTVTIELVSE